jgi:hypothetical protein
MTAPSQPPPEPPSPEEFRLSQPAADQFAYHVRMSAVFAVAGQTEESASEAVLAWAILSSQWSAAEARATEVGAELIDQSVASVSDRARTAATSRARGLALDVEAHFVTVGRQEEASMYAAVADQLEHAVDALLPER